MERKETREKMGAHSRESKYGRNWKLVRYRKFGEELEFKSNFGAAEGERLGLGKNKIWRLEGIGNS